MTRSLPQHISPATRGSGRAVSPRPPPSDPSQPCDGRASVLASPDPLNGRARVLASPDLLRSSKRFALAGTLARLTGRLGQSTPQSTPCVSAPFLPQFCLVHQSPACRFQFEVTKSHEKSSFVIRVVGRAGQARRPHVRAGTIRCSSEPSAAESQISVNFGKEMVKKW